VGVPEIIALPVPGLKLSPLGRSAGSSSEIGGVGLPAAEIVYDPAVPIVNVAGLALVIDGAIGAAVTVTVTVCVASGFVPFAAWTVTWAEPGAPVGVPEIIPVPEPAAPGVKVSPPGSEPVSEIVAAGWPVLVIPNELFAPATKLAWLALVIAGATPATLIVSGWSSGAPTPLSALTFTMTELGAPVGVPEIVPVPPAPAVNNNPAGSVPGASSEIVASGAPVLVIVNVPWAPSVKFAGPVLVIAGAAFGV
jgi:hypothetical protein